MRSETRSDSRLFRELMRALLQDGFSVRFRAHGRSMFPAIGDTETLQIEPAPRPPRGGEVVMVDSSEGIRVHRVLHSSIAGAQTRGDCCFEPDGAASEVVGDVFVVEGETKRPISRLRAGVRVRRWLAQWRGHF